MRHFVLLLITVLFSIKFTDAQTGSSTEDRFDYYEEGKALYNQRKYDSAIMAFKKAESLAMRKQDTVKRMNALYRIGLSYLLNEDYALSGEYFAKTLRFEFMHGDSSRIAKGYNNVGIAKYYLSELDSCLFYYGKALEIYRANGNRELPQFLKNIGIVYKKKGDYEKASEHLFESALRFENQKKTVESASIYNILGSMYNESGYDSLALRYHNLALDSRIELRDTLAIAESLNNLANVVKKVYGADSSMIMYRKALKLTGELKSKGLTSKILNNIGEVYSDWGDYKKGRDFFLRSLAIKEELGDEYGIAHTSLGLAKILMQEKEYNEAESIILEGLEVANSINALNLSVQYHGIYSQLLTATRKYQKATLYYGLYLDLKDSLLNEFKIKSLSEAEVKFKTNDLEKKVAFLAPLEGQIEILNLERKNQREKLRFQKAMNWGLAIGSAVILIFTVLLWRINRQNKKINELLELKNEEVTHRIKNNLEVLTGIFSNQSRITNNAAVRSMLDQNKHRLKVIHHLHNRLSSEPSHHISAKIYFEGLIDDLLFSFNFSKNNCSIAIDEVQINTDTLLHMGLLLNELVTNAIKHGVRSSEGTQLAIGLKGHSDRLVLSVRDNGPGLKEGIDPEQLDSYGMVLIDKIVKRQLEGHLTYHYENGALFKVTVPL